MRFRKEGRRLNLFIRRDGLWRSFIPSWPRGVADGVGTEEARTRLIARCWYIRLRILLSISNSLAFINGEALYPSVHCQWVRRAPPLLKHDGNRYREVTARQQRSLLRRPLLALQITACAALTIVCYTAPAINLRDVPRHPGRIKQRSALAPRYFKSNFELKRHHHRPYLLLLGLDEALLKSPAGAADGRSHNVSRVLWST